MRKEINLKKISKLNFSRDAELAPWEHVIMVEDVDDKVLVFEYIINELLDKHAPKRTFKVTHSHAEWFNNEILEFRKMRDKSKYEFNASDGLDVTARERFRKYRNIVNKLIRKSKKKLSLT